MEPAEMFQKTLEFILYHVFPARRESMFSRIMTSVVLFSTDYRMFLNVASAMLCVLLADATVQLFYERPRALQKYRGATWSYNVWRSARLLLVAGIMGVMSHAWYTGLDSVYDSTGPKDVTAKIILDEVVMAPAVITAYIFAVGLLEGNALRNVYQEWRAKFTDVYKTDLIVWPGIQIINFLLVPAQLRLVYINLCSLCWNIYLNHVKHTMAVGEAPLPVKLLTCSGDELFTHSPPRKYREYDGYLASAESR